MKRQFYVQDSEKDVVDFLKAFNDSPETLAATDWECPTSHLIHSFEKMAQHISLKFIRFSHHDYSILIKQLKRAVESGYFQMKHAQVDLFSPFSVVPMVELFQLLTDSRFDTSKLTLAVNPSEEKTNLCLDLNQANCLKTLVIKALSRSFSVTPLDGFLNPNVNKINDLTIDCGNSYKTTPLESSFHLIIEACLPNLKRLCLVHMAIDERKDHCTTSLFPRMLRLEALTVEKCHWFLHKRASVDAFTQLFGSSNLTFLRLSGTTIRVPQFMHYYQTIMEAVRSKNELLEFHGDPTTGVHTELRKAVEKNNQRAHIWSLISVGLAFINANSGSPLRHSVRDLLLKGNSIFQEELNEKLRSLVWKFILFSKFSQQSRYDQKETANGPYYQPYHHQCLKKSARKRKRGLKLVAHF